MIRTIVICFISQVIAKPMDGTFELIKRKEWGARPPTATTPMTTPTPYVIIHHSYEPAACHDLATCTEAMHWMQDLHQLNRTWFDIGYNFAVGGDGRVYEGRGWGVVGAHAPKYNDRSIGICLIGDWQSELPPREQLATAHRLIKYGVEHGEIADNYVLHGHRQVRETACPGQALYDEITTWPHFEHNNHV